MRYAHEQDRPLRTCQDCGHLTGAHALFVGHCHVPDCGCLYVTVASRPSEGETDG